MQISILKGVYSKGTGLRTAYPVNLMPIPHDSGVSAGYLKPFDGIRTLGTGPGVDRGGVEWNGVCYRVMGDRLVKVLADGTVTDIGAVGNDSLPVSFTFGFDRMGIASDGKLFYYDGAALTQVTDPDLANVVDVEWIDGYFMTTDGTYLVVTDLNDPMAVNPLKYGSSEVDPDPVKALVKIRNEMYALNRYTIEVFDNVGGEFFPFQRVEGAQITKGIIGTHAACCIYGDMLAFLGSGRNEAPSVYLGQHSQATKVSTDEIDTTLAGYSELELAASEMEQVTINGRMLLMLHLPDRCLVYDIAASQKAGEHVWFVLTSGNEGFSRYRGKNFVWCYDKWLCADPDGLSVGYLDEATAEQWGAKCWWEFCTPIVYNASRGGLFHEIELVALPGRADLGKDPNISTSYSLDGLTWSVDKWISAGKQGSTLKRLVWYRNGSMRNMRIQRFHGDSDCKVSFLRLEAQLEPLGA